MPLMNITKIEIRFLDKMGLTGSTIQLINGVILLVSFAGTRLIYGMYQVYYLSLIVFPPPD